MKKRRKVGMMIDGSSTGAKRMMSGSKTMIGEPKEKREESAGFNPTSIIMLYRRFHYV
ncbi:MAG: hypothetical protein R6V01_06450 [Thermoplasmatota archaeon]